jgi:thiol-disulfide isomerase/thioredoxin
MRHFILITAVLHLIACFDPQGDITGHEGKALPSFKLLKMDSSTYFDTKEIPSGKPYVFFYFSSHCPYSRAQMQDILSNMNKLKNFHFYVFSGYPFKEIKKFYIDYQLKKYSNITIGCDFKNFFSSYFKITSVPFLAIYGKDKKLKVAFARKVFYKSIKDAVED